MKKIGKLAINAEKVIKNEALVNLRGGYSYCICYITWNDGTQTTTSGLCGTSSDCTTCGKDLEKSNPDIMMADCE